MKPNQDSFEMKFDKLIISVGSDSNTFNTKGVKENTFFLKNVKDANRIKNRIIDIMETASLPQTTEEEKKQLCNFLVVGGGVSELFKINSQRGSNMLLN
jgi:NADH dehydrogenase FAD-containing subunit